MSRSAHSRHQRCPPSSRRRWRTLRLMALLAFVGLALVAVGLALAANAQVVLGQPEATTSCQPARITTTAGQPAKWYSIGSGSAAEIVRAVQCTEMFQSAAAGNDLIASAVQHGTLGTPVLVKPYRGDVGLAQYWVVPVVDQHQYPLALLTFFYDPQARVIEAAEFDAVTGDMFYVRHVFPAVTAQRAVTAVVAGQHVAAAPGRAPELIYFPGDLAGVKAGRVHWSAGGTAVIDPIWRVAGENGRWYYVDHAGQVHRSTDLPVDPTYLAMPAATTTQ
jgi:hypothetical protein